MARTKTSKTDKIRDLLAQGKSVKQIAARLKISPSAVYQVRWRDAQSEEAAQTLEVTENEEFIQAPDLINHPPHYTVGGIETIDFIEAKRLGYLLGNAVKYISRAAHKGGIEDLKKARWYIERAISHGALSHEEQGG